MAAINVTISGVLADKYGRTLMPCTLYGELSYSGLGVGGGPIIPPGNGGSGEPPHIWGGADSLPPWVMPPIYYPPNVPPNVKPPEAPEPGDPTTAVPGNWPVNPIAPPEYLIVNYPGIGPVVVAPPAQQTAQPK